MVRWFACSGGSEGRRSDRLPPSALRVITRLPLAWTAPITVWFRPRLSSFRGKLESGTGRGEEVHAGSDLRRRLIYLDTYLRRDKSELNRIIVHEFFHFAWFRLGNPQRAEYEQLLASEMERHARGELGWSAELRKQALTAAQVRRRSQAWRAYACESFCDTAAWIYAGVRRHEEFTLAASHAARRKAWFAQAGEFRV